MILFFMNIIPENETDLMGEPVVITTVEPMRERDGQKLKAVVWRQPEVTTLLSGEHPLQWSHLKTKEHMRVHSVCMAMVRVQFI